MLEYVFFNQEPRTRFWAFLREQGIDAALAEGEDELLVKVQEDAVDDDLADAVDAFYDEMFALDQEIHSRERAAGSDEYQGSGVVVNLKDGTAVYADIPPALLNKVMEALTLGELSDLVGAIVDAVENPDPRSLCRRARDRAGLDC
jgi:hypothetical protein